MMLNQLGWLAAFEAMKRYNALIAEQRPVDPDPGLAREIAYRLAKVSSLREEIRAHSARIGTPEECPDDMTAVQMLAHETRQHTMFFALSRAEMLQTLHIFQQSRATVPPTLLASSDDSETVCSVA